MNQEKDLKKLLPDFYRRLFRRFGPQGWWPGRTRLEIIVGAVLTQNTSWANVERAIRNLRKAGLLNYQALIRARTGDIARALRPAGYFNIKTRRLKNILDYLETRYRGDLGRMARRDTAVLRDELLAVNGIGPETADSILLYAFGRPVFVVDAYTKRILERHGLTSGPADYHGVQALFSDNLKGSAALFNEYHALIVRAGKDFCRSRPLCAGCPLEFHLRGGTGRVRLVDHAHT